MSPIYAHEIFSDSDMKFLNGNHFGTFLCGDFITNILMYLFFIYIHKRNNAIVIYFLKFMSIFIKFMYSLLL